MGITHAPLTLQFAKQTVSITIPAISGECLLKHLRRHFANCLVDDGEITAVFRIEAPHIKEWQLWRDDILLQQTEAVTFLFEPLMQAILEQLITLASEHLLLHAGGVALGEQGVVLCGVSGSGKSTLTAHLLQNGFDYLSDEAVAIPLHLDTMAGFARSLVLKAGSDFMWRSQRASNGVLPLPGGLAWMTPEYLGGKLCQQATPQLLLFPQFKMGSDLSITPLSAAESAFVLFQNLANARNLPEQGFRLTAELARRMPAFWVTYGDETAVIGWLREQLRNP